MISLMIRGDFTETDLADLAATFRKVERRQPDKPFLFAILEADWSMAEGEAVIKRIFPRIEGDEPTFRTIPHMDVICPDGQVRRMQPDIGDTTPDLSLPVLLMAQGTVEIDGKAVRGEAWLRGDHYHFEPNTIETL